MNTYEKNSLISQTGYGLARFPATGPMEYLLTSGDWISDSKMYTGAPILIFESAENAKDYAKQHFMKVRVGAVQFELGSDGKVITL